MGASPVTFSDIPPGFKSVPEAGGQEFSDIPEGFKSLAPEQGFSIGARHEPKTLAEKVQRLAGDFGDDLRYGTGQTMAGSLLRKMGAQPLYSGTSEGAAEMVESLPLGLTKAVEGGAQLAQPGRRWQGTKDVASGLLQASTLPGGFVAPEAAEASTALAGKLGPPVGKTLKEAVKGVAKLAIDVPLFGRGKAALDAVGEAGGNIKKIWQKPPVYPGAFLPEHPGVFPGANLPATPPPEFLNPSLVSPARTLPGQLSREVTRAPRVAPAAPLPSRQGLMLPGKVDPAAALARPAQSGVPLPGEALGKIPARPSLIEQMGGKPVETITERSAWPPERPEIFPPRGPATGSAEDIAETRQIQDRIRNAAEGEDRSRLGIMRKDWFARNQPGLTKGELTGTPEKPVRYSKTPGVRLADKVRQASAQGTKVPGPAEDMTPLLKKSLKDAMRKKAD
jgi:hypothetical protein